MIHHDRIDRLRRISGLEHLADKTLETFDTAPKWISDTAKQKLSIAYDLAQNFIRSRDTWLFLYGPPGTGKTHLAAAVANALLEHGVEVIFATVPDLLDYLRAAFGPNSTESSDYRLQQLKNAEVLILDDLGAQHGTSWALEKLYQIINYRYMAQMPTVITSNHSHTTLEQRLSSRLADIRVVRSLELDVPDYRQGVGRGIPKIGTGLEIYQHMTINTWIERKDLPQADHQNQRRVREVIANYANEPRGWLMFIGPHGVGKTHSAAAIGHLYAERGGDVIFVSVPDLLDQLRAAYGPDSKISYDARFQQLRTIDLLFLDDIWAEVPSSWSREKLHQLLNYRFVTRASTVMTSRLTKEGIRERDRWLYTRLDNKDVSRVFLIRASKPFLGIEISRQSASKKDH
ncbi:MAG: ATP-binding protein [Anaerolineae bacterium]